VDTIQARWLTALGMRNWPSLLKVINGLALPLPDTVVSSWVGMPQSSV
jgi:hypothetical protein